MFHFYTPCKLQLKTSVENFSWKLQFTEGIEMENWAKMS